MQATGLHHMSSCSKRILKLIFSLLIVVLPSGSFAQSNPELGLPFITNYSFKVFDALPQTWAVIEDDRGFMYFGVQGLILEYDGIKWHKINMLSGNSAAGVARSFAKDKKGRIYYGAVGDFGYLGKDSLGQTISVSLLHLVPQTEREFFDVWTTYTTDEGIYFQSRDRIFLLNEKNEVKIWKPQTKFMYAFYLDGTYYVHQQNLGLMKLQNGSFELIPGSEFLGKERMNVMLPYTPPGSVGTASKQYIIGLFYSGLFVFDGKNFAPFKTEADDLIKASTLYKAALLADGNYALSTTGKGMAIIDNKGKILNLINRSVGLQDESVYAIFADSKGALWLALDNGISKVDMTSPLSQFTSQSGIFTSALTLTRFEGTLYAGTTNGVLRFNESARRFESVPDIPQNQTFNLLKDNGKLYVANDGLFSIKNSKTTLLRPSVGGDLQISGLLISKFHPDLFYVGSTFGTGVFQKDKSNSWKLLGFVPGMNDQFWTFGENKDGTVWAGTQSGVIYKITPVYTADGVPDISRFTFKKYDEADGFHKALGGVWHIKNENYFPADSVIYRFDEVSKRFIADTTFGVFPAGGGKDQFDMVEDSTGRVWVRFGKETVVATPAANGKYTIDRTALRTISEQTINKIFPDKDGIIWFCTTEGIVRYDARIQKNYDRPYKTFVRTIKAGTENLSADSATGENNAWIVPYKNNTLRFSYAAPFFEREEKTQYQTWLEGFEKNWSDWDNNYYKEYTNLPEGTYHFHVRAKNIYRRISQEAVYSFVINPPWWRTWWAYLLYALTVIAIVYFVVRNRTKHLQEKHRELEKVVSDRTLQLSQRVEELAVINSVQDALVREMDMQAIYELVGSRIRDVFNSQVVVIATFDHENNQERFNYLIEKGQRSYPPPRPLDKLRQYLIQTKQKIIINSDTQNAMKKFGLEVLPGTETPKSAVFVPLTIGDKINSYISLQDLDKENAFTEPDVRLLETLANSMSVALENARLFEETKLLLSETEKGKKNVELLSEIGKQITASLDFETIFHKLYENINQLADATIFGVGIYNANKQQLEYKYAVENGKRYKPYVRDTKDKDQFPVWCIENRKPVFINDLREEYSNYIQSYDDKTKELVLEDGTSAEEPMSMIYLPLIVQEQVLGVITIQSFKKNAYTPYHLSLLQNLATYTGIAIDNANAYRKLNEREQEIGQRAAELSAVNSISQALVSQLNTDELIKLVGDSMLELFKANIVYMALVDSRTKMINFPYQHGDNMPPMRLGEGLTSKIILNNKPLLINKELQEQRAQLGVQQIGVPAASYLGVPIPVGDEIIGVLSVQSTETENRFNENDLRLLSTIAANVGVAIRKARLFEEVQQAKMEAESARKTAEKANAAKSAFLSTVSHELRTPLTSVLGFAKIIKKRLEERIFPLTDKSDPKTEKATQQVSENLGVVISEGERLTTLINDVLDLAKIEAGRMEWNMENVSLNEIVERATTVTTTLFEQKNLKLEKDFQPDLPDISGDRDKLIQVVVNLLSNAVKFTPQGVVTCSVERKKDEIIVSVTDTGIGIKKEDYGAVFEQFKQVGGDTLTDKPKGTGLGLPICKEIVEHHGGRIWLESEVGKGSTFSFALPVVKQTVIKPIQFSELVRQLKEQVAQSNLNIKGRKASILVVDDDESIRSLLQQELGDAGYEIEEATNGKEAVARVRSLKPDLVILDIMMPEMNGFDVAAVLKNDPQTMDIPIIVLSIVQDKTRGFRIGVDRYLTKPIDTSLLFNEIGNLLEQGKSKKKVMVVDEDSGTVNTLTDVLKAKGYFVVESDGRELIEKAVATQPDIIMINSVLSGKQEVVQTLRFEKGLENVLFLVYQ